MLVSTQPIAQTYAARVQPHGQVTIPQPVRESLSLNQGDILTIMQIGDTLLLTPKVLRTPALAEQFTKIMEEEGVSLDDLLEGLAEEREIIYQERQANAA